MRPPGNKDTYPCHYCTDRTLGCHGVCKDYIEAAAKEKERKEQERANSTPVIANNSFIGGPRVVRHNFRK